MLCLQTERKFPDAFYSALENSSLPCWPSLADPWKPLALAEARENLSVLSARFHYLNSSWQTLSLDKVLFFLQVGLPLLCCFLWDSPGSPPVGQFSCLVFAREETTPCLLLSPFEAPFFSRIILPGSLRSYIRLHLSWEALTTTTVFIFCLWHLFQMLFLTPHLFLQPASSMIALVLPFFPVEYIFSLNSFSVEKETLTTFWRCAWCLLLMLRG